MPNTHTLTGTGLGLRRELLPALQHAVPQVIDFFEIAPENWMGMGGVYAEQLHPFTEAYPFVAHGLSLSLGSPDPLDESFLQEVKTFLDAHHILLYSEHLSYCSSNGHLYDLLPIPFTEDAVRYVAGRIRRTQEILERKIAIENVSYYFTPTLPHAPMMSELEFLTAVLEESDCWLHLDVNNIYVNACNHGYSAYDFLEHIPNERLRYIHIAGHHRHSQELIIDTHGSDVCKEVWDLLDRTYHLHGVHPTLLERDFNFPPLSDLEEELHHIAQAQKRAARSNL